MSSVVDCVHNVPLSLYFWAFLQMYTCTVGEKDWKEMDQNVTTDLFGGMGLWMKTFSSLNFSVFPQLRNVTLIISIKLE
jgi:hypothetical protein